MGDIIAFIIAFVWTIISSTRAVRKDKNGEGPGGLSILFGIIWRFLIVELIFAVLSAIFVGSFYTGVFSTLFAFLGR